MTKQLSPLAMLLALLAVFAAAIATAKPQPHPNVIVILTEDQGYGDLSCHGNPVLKTPNLDRLHDQSVRLTDFVVQCALWDEYEKATKWAGAVLWDKWRLIKGHELYDLRSDPGQDKDIAAQHPEIVAKMRAHYEQWWNQVEPLASEFNPIHLGSKYEKVTALNCHDWVAPNTADQQSVRSGITQNGPWHVLVERSGEYEIALRRWSGEADLPITSAAPSYHGKLANYPAGKALPIASAQLSVGGITANNTVTAEDKASVFRVKLPAGRTTLQTWFFDRNGKDLCGAYFVYVKRRN